MKLYFDLGQIFATLTRNLNQPPQSVLATEQTDVSF